MSFKDKQNKESINQDLGAKNIAEFRALTFKQYVSVRSTTVRRKCLWYRKFLRSVQSLSRVRLFPTPWITARQASLSITNSRSSLKLMSPSSRWCHPAISSSVIPFSSCPQFLPAPESFPMSQFFTSGSQSIGVSASASVLPMNIQHWFPLPLTCCISLQSKGLSRVFSNTTVQKHQFFGAQLSL